MKFKFSKFFILILLLAVILGIVGILSNRAVKVSYISPTVENTEFFAECDGYISSADKGNYTVTAYILEKDIPNIKINSKVTVTGAALGSNSFEGYINYIFDQAEVITNNGFSKTAVKCEITITNGNSSLKKGYNVTAKVLTLRVENALVVDYTAVDTDGKNYWVYLINNDVAQKKYIEIFKESENGYIINSGVEINDKIVTEPQSIKGDNIRVNATVLGE